MDKFQQTTKKLVFDPWFYFRDFNPYWYFFKLEKELGRLRVDKSKALATKPDKLSWSGKNYTMKDRTNFPNLSSDPHMHTMAHAHTPFNSSYKWSTSVHINKRQVNNTLVYSVTNKCSHEEERVRLCAQILYSRRGAPHIHFLGEAEAKDHHDF